MSTPLILGLIVSVWVLCGVLGFGMTYAHFQRSWPRIAKGGARGDAVLALFIGLAGPLGVLVALFLSGAAAHGLMYPGREDWRREAS